MYHETESRLLHDVPSDADVRPQFHVWCVADRRSESTVPTRISLTRFNIAR
ncbi:hypothetical protein RSSM_00090 [Rhodopirellula sallentina SM41]|uniref:Uncharacterized protein n=1 Tax=Rhodopirellula sallentina SM41 TaxID=1263870 RepID=M5UAM2_9BACT|nr:hypothetical protein RSSM_00090 [Rhodopirellula sallentina SM41]